MTVRLRPHHLLCMLTYVGKGYSRAFIENYDRIAGRLAAGEAIEIVAGPDEICAPMLPAPDCHCRRTSVRERDETAAREVGALLGVEIGPGRRLALDPEMLGRMRVAFAAGTIRGACAGCDWSDLCTAIAEGGYDGVRLTPSAGPRAACS